MPRRPKAPVKPAIRPHCYLCGVTENLTDDHIPPKGFFPTKKRINLIKAPLCQTCHNSALSADDEAMMLWLSSAFNASASGKVIQKKALARLEKNPTLKKNVQRHFAPLPASDLGVLSCPIARINPFIRRITKGLLYLYYPDYNYFENAFAVFPDWGQCNAILPAMKHESRGDDVFDFWHAGTPDKRNAPNLWIYRFYQAVSFVCFVSNTWKQPFIPAYKEFHKLPTHL